MIKKEKSEIVRLTKAAVYKEIFRCFYVYEYPAMTLKKIKAAIRRAKLVEPKG